jgi:hypothetical protein
MIRLPPIIAARRSCRQRGTIWYRKLTWLSGIDNEYQDNAVVEYLS